MVRQLLALLFIITLASASGEQLKAIKFQLNAYKEMDEKNHVEEVEKYLPRHEFTTPLNQWVKFDQAENNINEKGEFIYLFAITNVEKQKMRVVIQKKDDKKAVDVMMFDLEKDKSIATKDILNLGKETETFFKATFGEIKGDTTGKALSDADITTLVTDAQAEEFSAIVTKVATKTKDAYTQLEKLKVEAFADQDLKKPLPADSKAFPFQTSGEIEPKLNELYTMKAAKDTVWAFQVENDEKTIKMSYWEKAKFDEGKKKNDKNADVEATRIFDSLENDKAKQFSHEKTEFWIKASWKADDNTKELQKTDDDVLKNKVKAAKDYDAFSKDLSVLPKEEDKKEDTDNTKINNTYLKFYDDAKCEKEHSTQVKNMDFELQAFNKFDKTTMFFLKCNKPKELYLKVIEKKDKVEPREFPKLEHDKCTEILGIEEFKGKYAKLTWKGACTSAANSEVRSSTPEDTDNKTAQILSEVEMTSKVEEMVKNSEKFDEAIKKAPQVKSSEPDKKKDDKKSGMSPGTIAGIVIGSLAGVALFAGLAWYLCNNKN